MYVPLILQRLPYVVTRHRFPMRPLLQVSNMKLHNSSCVYIAIKYSGCSDSIPLQSPDVFDIKLQLQVLNVRLYCNDDNCLSSTR